MAEADFDGELALPLAAASDEAWIHDAREWGRTDRLPSRGLHDRFKRSFDWLGSLILALVFAPIILCIVLAVRRSGGPVFFPHERVGLNGRSFRCYKFRTMVPNADERLEELLNSDDALAAEWQEIRKLRNDPRVTPIGRFLRKTSLDELPQIWNVLRGDMSLVGPRPIVRDELRLYGRNLGIYLGSKPGLTGLWQVTGRSDACYRRRVAMDVYYSRNKSLLLDFSILLKTVKVVLTGSGAY
ncbi:MAG: exopolysaccharide biosynthesis polyprenyl glycosylphosphotransferase [Hydrocarboniphaga sp.]|uniref:sugar transferase n=1 Tax=Hydrocarboniphaga sp. TaxID=2033016 RepID=UPI0026086C55|nr:sugar transferase [Hydrocarboniphaga sp.]MDB5968935.1 exopolysaccharide biosynthesis polyprenyl glycosylphosphotransferase [Hydrocarboniphaga sp.]